MGEKSKNHEVDDYIEPDTSFEMKETQMDWARNVATMKSFNQDGTVNIEKTRAMRDEFIEQRGIRNISESNPNFEWGEDEDGLQILVRKQN